MRWDAASINYSLWYQDRLAVPSAVNQIRDAEFRKAAGFPFKVEVLQVLQVSGRFGQCRGRPVCGSLSCSLSWLWTKVCTRPLKGPARCQSHPGPGALQAFKDFALQYGHQLIPWCHSASPQTGHLQLYCSIISVWYAALCLLCNLSLCKCGTKLIMMWREGDKIHVCLQAHIKNVAF